jgi:chloride channel protein, CIC family
VSRPGGFIGANRRYTAHRIETVRRMLGETLKRLRRIGARLGFERDWYLIVVAAGIGLLMGGAATAFILPIHAVEEWSRRGELRIPLWVVPVAPVVGALLTGLLFHFMGAEGRGSGISHVMYAIYRRKSRLPLRLAFRKWIGSTLTIASGGSGGAEGPIVTIGSSIASSIARLLGANPQHSGTLLGCGAAAGIASVFNAPFAGIFFAMEILLRDFSLRTFTPIVIAAVISAAFTQALLGTDEALFPAALGAEAFHAVEIPNYLLLGLVCGIVAVLFTRAVDLSERSFSRLPVPLVLRPACGAAMLGLIGVGYILIARPENTWPPFYGNGYATINALLDTATYYGEDGLLAAPTGILAILAVIAVLKALATCLTVGAGSEGGLFAPSLLVGAAVGGFTGHIINSLGWFPSASPAHYALVGMAAVVAGTTHAPLTAILIVYEITRSYQIILPLMFAAVISTIFGRLLYAESVYTIKLTREGVRVGALSDLTILRRLTVRDVPLERAVTVFRDDSAQKLLDLSEEHAAAHFVVVDDAGHYVGLVMADDLRAALVYREAIPLLQVNEIMRGDLPTVGRDETLDIVLDTFSKHDAQTLAVVDELDETKAVGLLTRSRMLAKYQSVLSRT